MRVSQGASRLQEALADRWAVAAYGSAAFEQGLTHVIAQSVRFEKRANWSVEEALRESRPLANLYRYEPVMNQEMVDEVDRDVRSALEAEATPYDSHPAPGQRLAWVRAYASDGEGPEADDTLPAWSLFAEREALEHTMTAAVRASIEGRHGVKFAST